MRFVAPVPSGRTDVLAGVNKLLTRSRNSASLPTYRYGNPRARHPFRPDADMTAWLDLLLAEATDAQIAALAERLLPSLRHQQGYSADLLLSPADAAAQLGIHPKTLTRAARDGRVPGARLVGRCWRFDPTMLDLLPVSRTRIDPVAAHPRRRASPTNGARCTVDAIRGPTRRR